MNVFVYTDNPSHILYESDTIQTKKYYELHAAIFTVPRSKDSLQFVLISDSLRREVRIPSKISVAYYLNIVYPMWPGFLFDLSNPKRYTYKNSLTFDKNLDLSIISTSRGNPSEEIKSKMSNEYFWKDKNRYLTQKGDFYFNLTIPFIYPGYTILKPSCLDYLEKGSLLGFSGGFDYYYKNNRFFNLSASASFGGDIVIGCIDDNFNDSERFNLYNVSISHNHRYERFSFGYGLAQTYINWGKEKYFDTYPDKSAYNYDKKYFFKERNYSTLGFAFNVYFYFSNEFAFGVIYKPTFVRLNSIMEKKICYEHQLSFDFAFKIRLNKRKK